MNHKFKVGDIAYLVENNRYVSEGKITYICGDIITFKFISGKGGTKVKAHRLFDSEEYNGPLVKTTLEEIIVNTF